MPKKSEFRTKINSKGYKLHVDSTDTGIPVNCILSSASVHHSQAAIPLVTITHQRVTNLYDIIDATHDLPVISEQNQSLGHIPIINTSPKQGPKSEIFRMTNKSRILSIPVFKQHKMYFKARNLP